MNDSTSPPFDFWQPLGERWWLERGAEVGASPQQIKFACAKHRGIATGDAVSNTEAARQAGYKNKSSDPSAIRGGGYRAASTRAVERLMAFAAAEMRGEIRGPMDIAAIRRELEAMARGTDPTHKLWALESLLKMDERRGAVAPDDDGFSEARTVRDLLHVPNGATCSILWLCGMGQGLQYMPLLRDVKAGLAREPFGLEIWERLASGLGGISKDELHRYLADGQHQLEARKLLWAEVGILASESPVLPTKDFPDAVAPPTRTDNEHTAVATEARSTSGANGANGHARNETG